MSSALVDVHNLDALLIGTGEFHFSEGATTAALAGGVGKGYRSFDNVKAFALQPEAEQKEHVGSYRGVRRVDKTIVTQVKFGYRLTLDTFDLQKFLFMYFGVETTAFTQAALATANGDALAFSGGSPSEANKWYDIRYSGARVREISALTIATLTENTDFVVDTKLGRIRFLVAQSSSLTPVITAPEITSASSTYLKALTPLEKTLRKGIARLVCYDQNDDNIIVFDHVDFGCEVYLNNQTEVSGDDFSSYELIVKLTSPVGTVYAREV